MIKLREKGMLKAETGWKQLAKCECKRKVLKGNVKYNSSEHRNGKKAK